MLETLNMKKSLSKTAYDKAMNDLQVKMRSLQYAMSEAKIPTVICLEGWDTAGKGQLIKRFTEKLDPRLFRVHPGSAPSPLEKRFHFLWRYQVALPNDGSMSVFDHSWYGRVLVERVDKLTRKKEWKQAYQQINEFERWLTDDNQLVLKFWLHITKKEQKKRFKKLAADAKTRYRITGEYKRHHRDYDKWLVAAEEMLAKCDTPNAPWTVIEANDGRWCRVRFFETLVRRAEEALARSGELAKAKAKQAEIAAQVTRKRVVAKKAKKAKPRKAPTRVAGPVLPAAKSPVPTLVQPALKAEAAHA